MTRQEVIDKYLPSMILFAMSVLREREELDNICIQDGADLKVDFDDLTDKNADKVSKWIDENVTEDDD